MSESNDPWDSIKSTPQAPAGNPYYPSATPAKPTPQGPGLAPLHDPPGWRGDLINQLAIVGLVVSILATVIGLLCCGILPMAGLGFTIPAFWMAQHDLKTFAGTVHPDFIDKLTFSRNLALGGLIVASIGTLLGLICLGLNFGFFVLQMALEQQG